jgi:hypothetical protein
MAVTLLIKQHRGCHSHAARFGRPDAGACRAAGGMSVVSAMMDLADW